MSDYVVLMVEYSTVDKAGYGDDLVVIDTLIGS